MNKLKTSALGLAVSGCFSGPQVVEIRVDEPETQTSLAAAAPTTPPTPSRPPALAEKLSAPSSAKHTETVAPSVAVQSALGPAHDQPSLSVLIEFAKSASGPDYSGVHHLLAQTQEQAWPHALNYLRSPIAASRSDLANLRPVVDSLPAPTEKFEDALVRFFAIEDRLVSPQLRPLLREMMIRQALLASLQNLATAPDSLRRAAIDLAADLGTTQRPWFGAISRASVVQMGDAAIPSLLRIARASPADSSLKALSHWANALLDRMGVATPERAIAKIRTNTVYLHEAVAVLSETPDSTSLSALADLIDHPNVEVRNASRQRVSQILESKILSERASHQLVCASLSRVLDADPGATTVLQGADHLSAEQVWQVGIAEIDRLRRDAQSKRLDQALASRDDAATAELLGMDTEDLSGAQRGKIAAELALRAEAVSLAGNPRRAAQLARKAASLAHQPELAQRLKSRAYAMLGDDSLNLSVDSQKAPRRSVSHRGAWPRTFAISALGATFLLGIRRRKKYST